MNCDDCECVFELKLQNENLSDCNSNLRRESTEIPNDDVRVLGIGPSEKIPKSNVQQTEVGLHATKISIQPNSNIKKKKKKKNKKKKPIITITSIGR